MLQNEGGRYCVGKVSTVHLQNTFSRSILTPPFASQQINSTAEEIKKYSWPLNNKGLNCVGPLVRGFFSINVLEYFLRDLLHLK